MPSHADDVVSTTGGSHGDTIISRGWVHVPKAQENQTAGSSNPGTGNLDQAPSNVTEQKQEQKETEAGAAFQVTAAVEPRVNNFIEPLRELQKTHEHVLDRVFELNIARAPVLKQLDGLVRSLQEVINGLSDFARSVNLPEFATVQLGEFQQKLHIFSQSQIASLRADEAKRVDTEDDIIQALSRSGRYLDKLLQTTAFVPSPLLYVDNVSDPAHDEEIATENFERASIDDQYLSRTGDLDLIQEKLADLRAERIQLLEEQDSRAQFGLSLDDDSLGFLESFERQEQPLLAELELAERSLEALRQSLHESDVLRTPNQASTSEREEDSTTPLDAEVSSATETDRKTIRDNESSPFLGLEPRDINETGASFVTTIDQTEIVNTEDEAINSESVQSWKDADETDSATMSTSDIRSTGWSTTRDADSSTLGDNASMNQEETNSISGAISTTSTLRQSALLASLRAQNTTFEALLKGPGNTPINPADFINAWLLNQMRNQPRLLRKFFPPFLRHHEDAHIEDLEHLFREQWFGDSSATEFAQYRNFADQQSMQANLADSQDLRQRSLIAAPVRSKSMSLLRMGPSTTTQDIITHALQAQGIPPSRMSDTTRPPYNDVPSIFLGPEISYSNPFSASIVPFRPDSPALSQEASSFIPGLMENEFLS